MHRTSVCRNGRWAEKARRATGAGGAEMAKDGCQKAKGGAEMAGAAMCWKETYWRWNFGVAVIPGQPTG